MNGDDLGFADEQGREGRTGVQAGGFASLVDCIMAFTRQGVQEGLRVWIPVRRGSAPLGGCDDRLRGQGTSAVPSEAVGDDQEGRFSKGIPEHTQPVLVLVPAANMGELGDCHAGGGGVPASLGSSTPSQPTDRRANKVQRPPGVGSISGTAAVRVFEDAQGLGHLGSTSLQ